MHFKNICNTFCGKTYLSTTSSCLYFYSRSIYLMENLLNLSLYVCFSLFACFYNKQNKFSNFCPAMTPQKPNENSSFKENNLHLGSPSPRKKRNNSTPTRKSAAEKKQILHQLVSPSAKTKARSINLWESARRILNLFSRFRFRSRWES